MSHFTSLHGHWIIEQIQTQGSESRKPGLYSVIQPLSREESGNEKVLGGKARGRQ